MTKDPVAPREDSETDRRIHRPRTFGRTDADDPALRDEEITVGFATLLFDLLTPDEERNRANVFDIALLASRLIHVTGWLAGQPDTAALPVGYFGASTGAGAALAAAAHPGVKAAALVFSRRPP